MPIASIGISPTSAKGDILSSDGSSRSRVPVGTNGQVLTAQSTATSGMQFESPSFASPAYELIASSLLTANAATVTFSSIPTTYKWLKVIGQARGSTTGGAQPIIVLNSNTSKSYTFANLYRSGTASVTTEMSSRSNGMYLAVTGNTGDGLTFEVDISGSTSTSLGTVFYSRCAESSNANSPIRWSVVTAKVELGAAITSILFKNISTDVYGANSQFLLYGRKV
jgi:hypothetical protein